MALDLAPVPGLRVEGEAAMHARSDLPGAMQDLTPLSPSLDPPSSCAYPSSMAMVVTLLWAGCWCNGVQMRRLSGCLAVAAQLL
jgi:hypothetical protein